MLLYKKEMPKTRPDRLLVWRGEKEKTTGGLRKSDLVRNKSGRIVSKRASNAAKKKSHLGELLKKPGDKFDAHKKAVKKEEGAAHKKMVAKRAKPKRIKLEPAAPRVDGSQKAFDPKAKNRTKISVENIIFGKRRKKRK